MSGCIAAVGLLSLSVVDDETDLVRNYLFFNIIFLHFLRETLLLAVIVAHRLKQDDDFSRSEFSFVALLNRSLS